MTNYKAILESLEATCGCTHAAANAAVAIRELLAERDAKQTQAPELRTVNGNLLPPIGSSVLIHLGRQDAWVKHTVTGYYVWGDLEGATSLHRVFVRVVDGEGYPNARMLKDVRPVARPTDC